jgi:serine/threonine protein kinase
MGWRGAADNMAQQSGQRAEELPTGAPTGPVPAPRRQPRYMHASGERPLDGYTIKRGIGVGGFGEVYFAISDAGKEVALKRIQRNLDIELRGVRQCLNLKHVNLIALWDIRTGDQGESWVVMEYVPGHSLRDVLQQHRSGLLEADLRRWFLSICAGVSYLHDRGIVHRDLKPGNIFYDADEQIVKIGDYGLSKFISCSQGSGHTESVGTFHYMAPEIGRGIYGKGIDIYALGIILFEMLTGELPFDGESSQEIIMKHLTASPSLVRIPAAYREVIETALAKDPEARYANVRDLLRALPWEESQLSANGGFAPLAPAPSSSGCDLPTGRLPVAEVVQSRGSTAETTMKPARRGRAESSTPSGAGPPRHLPGRTICPRPGPGRRTVAGWSGTGKKNRSPARSATVPAASCTGSSTRRSRRRSSS